MDQKISKLQEEIEQLDEKMQIVIAKGQALQARRRKKENWKMLRILREKGIL